MCLPENVQITEIEVGIHIEIARSKNRQIN